MFRFNWPLLALAAAISGIGLYNLYVVGLAQDGGWQTHAAGHLVRLILGLIAFLIVSLLDIRFIRFLSYAGMGVALALLVYVRFYGEDYGTGAQRWIDIGNFSCSLQKLRKWPLLCSSPPTLMGAVTAIWPIHFG